LFKIDLSNPERLVNRMKFIYITAPNLTVAEILATKLVEESLAACVNILPGMRSFYRWEGKLEQAEEVVVIAKCPNATTHPLIERVKALHPYECPCIIALDVTDGEHGFVEWVDSVMR
jgi:periplasmic divalent cation tolerance protein